MNIRFHNLGKIKETELDLKPMTVIIGPNNSNKTYIAYSVYGLWQSLVNVAYGSDLQLKGHADGSMSVEVASLREAFTAQNQRFIEDFARGLANFYQDSSNTLFSNTQYQVAVSKEEFNDLLASLLETTMNVSNIGPLALSVKGDTLLLTSIKGVGLEAKNTGEVNRIRGAFRHEASLVLDFALRTKLFGHPYLLPAERNAFVITYKVLANRRLKLMLDAQRRLFSSRETSKRQVDLLKEAGEVRYPQPIEDFLELLFEIETETKPFPQNGMGKLATDIENSIQNGNKINFRATALGGQEIMVDVGGGLNIDLYNASSSIKQLAPLLLYLRYRASKGDLLIIDEPEMNLHPESQAKLLEVLAMLVNEGVYVLLTTHSPYIMAHLNNLAQATEVSAAAKRKQAKSLYLGDSAALLDMDQISAYEMRDNQLHSLKDPDYGIRWDTLSDVSGELQQKFFQIYEEGHTPERAKTTRKPAKTSGQ